jgi:hypothetical protein
MTYRHRFTLLPFSILWFALGAPAEDAGNYPSTTMPAAQSDSGGDLKLIRFPAVLSHNLTSNLFTRGNLLPFLIGSAASLAIAPADQEISRSMSNHVHEWRHRGNCGPNCHRFHHGRSLSCQSTDKEQTFPGLRIHTCAGLCNQCYPDSGD